MDSRQDRILIVFSSIAVGSMGFFLTLLAAMLLIEYFPSGRDVL
jgi:hypothetical protein